MKRLQDKIFLFFVILLLLVQSAVLFSNYLDTEKQKQDQIESQLTSAKSNFSNEFNRRSYYLAAFAETAAKDFGLKQVFEEDTRSFLVALNNHRKRINADMAIAVNSDGKIVGQLINTRLQNNKFKVKVGNEQGQSFRFMNWLESPESSYLYGLNSAVYQLSFSPLKSGDLIVGWVGFGYSIDDRLSKRFADLTNLTTEFFYGEKNDWKHLSIYPVDKGFQETDALINQVMSGEAPSDIISALYPIGKVEDQQVFALMHTQRDDLIIAIHHRWLELAFIALLTLLVSLTGAYLIAKSISNPVKILVAQAKDVAQGNYERSIQIVSNDELGQLAHEFDHMKQAVISRERTISYQIFHDALTGLPNRQQLLINMDEKYISHNKPFVIIRLGLQGMSDVNYSLGQEVGDDVVRETANRLATISEPGKLFNIGGNGFALIVENIADHSVQSYFNSIEQVIEPALDLKNISLHVQVREGAAFFPEQSVDAQELLQMAGTAMLHAQQNGIQRLLYNHALTETITERLHLVNELKDAIESNQMVLFYQPKYNFKDRSVSEVEALVRWIHPEHGIIPPDKFIGLAEQTGHIHQLTRWVLNTALTQHKAWLSSDIKLPIAINISVENLKKPGFYQSVIDSLESHELTTEAIRLEVTESVIFDDPESAIKILDDFSSKGIHLSIDDYGTGYSSLEQVKRLPANEIKIDKTFIMELLKHDHDQEIVKSTINLAHALGVTVVAEGVEDQDTLDWLQLHGCDIAQGYFISRPQCAEDLIVWLHQSFDKTPEPAV